MTEIQVRRPPAGDWRTRRVIIEAALDRAAQMFPPASGVDVYPFVVNALDGTPLPLFLYRPTGTRESGRAALLLHGGGMIMGWHRVYDLLVRSYVALSGVPILSVQYRFAPEYPDPIPVEDCYAALVWLAEQSSALSVDPQRIAVMGGSAGGGLAAGVALLARDRGGPALAQQLLFAPMLDDRTETGSSAVASHLTWDSDDNITGWTALLGEKVGGETVSPYAAPARADDVSELPPTYIDVGGLDLFWREDLRYAERLMAAGVPTEFHLHAGAPHGFELFAPNSELAQRVSDDRVRRLKSL
ncbi:alpha/beta hydrolase [Mycobacterium kubicae]|uniref:alpha/beta hydrolase n=1 Tax=Mycobacterium kubicae TaxID=120959 RepID=UPI0009EDEE29|nr:alpha/beta hydrolase [Mycobacterium kubicae]